MKMLRPHQPEPSWKSWLLALRLLLCAGFFAVPGLGADSSRLITSIKSFKEATLLPGESERPVRIQATVTYADASWRSLFVQDDTGGVALAFPKYRFGIVAGDRLLIEGMAVPQSATNSVLELRDVVLTSLGKGKWPKAIPVGPAELKSPPYASVLVEVRGTVRSVFELGRLLLKLQVGEDRFSVWVRYAEPAELARLLDAEITVQGVCNQDYDPKTRQRGAEIFTVDFKSLKIHRPGPEDPYQGETTPIRSLAGKPTTGTLPPRVRIQGEVVEQFLGQSLLIRDETGEITLSTSQSTPLLRGDRVIAVGFPFQEKGKWVLQDAQYKVTTRVASAGMTAAQADLSLPVLTNVQQVLSLTHDEARKRYPVQVQGVITHFDGRWQQFFIEDQNAAICVDMGDQDLNLESGLKVMILGASKPGGVLNMITPARVEVLGREQLPEAQSMNYQQGITGDFDCRRVKVKATVQSVDVGEEHINLDLLASDGRFACTILQSTNSHFVDTLSNAVVEVRGICVLNLNDSLRPSGITIVVDRESDVRVVEPASADASHMPLREIGDVLGFLPGEVASRRLKVKGTVTLWRSTREFYVQNAGAAIFAKTFSTNRLEQGDEVELIGYRVEKECVPHLENAEFQILRHGTLPPPRTLRPTEALVATNHGLWVQMEGYLVEDVPSSAMPSLMLENGKSLFVAVVEPLEAEQRSPTWRAGSQVKVTGVLHLQSDDSRNPRTFRLLVPSPAQIEVLRKPSWFTRERVAGLSVLLALGVTLSLSWIAALRKRVAQQTDLIRRQLESEAAIEKRLALVWETSADGMRITDEAGITIQVNTSYCRIVGKSRKELEGRPFSLILRKEDAELALSDYRESFIRRTMPARQELAVVLWDGRKIWLDTSSALLEHADARPLLLTQCRDITDRKMAESEKEKLQDQLLQARKTESIGRLAGGVAHDFNNMLQVILGNTALALQQMPEGGKVHEELVEIQRSAERSAELTRQLLAFARKQTASPKVLDLNKTVDGLIKMLQRLIGENVQLTWKPGEGVGPVRIDPAQLDQVLVNLSVNARDAMPGGGRISIETAGVNLDDAYARSNPDCVPGDYVMLAVGDTGPGLGPEAREHLFEPFFTTKELGKGTGLGLATVFGIVKQNSGLINVHSEPGQGTTFKIYLPRAEASVSPRESLEPVALPPGKGTVLLVEDEEQILRLGRRILEQRGYTVLSAQDPERALTLAREAVGRIDLLITDVVMPGMNGKELCDRIRAIQPGIRCIYVSGYTADVIAHHGVLDGNVRFLQKPFTLKTLTEKVREALAEPS